jgi:hypothetical protein
MLIIYKQWIILGLRMPAEVGGRELGMGAATTLIPGLGRFSLWESGRLIMFPGARMTAKGQEPYLQLYIDNWNYVGNRLIP